MNGILADEMGLGKTIQTVCKIIKTILIFIYLFLGCFDNLFDGSEKSEWSIFGHCPTVNNFKLENWIGQMGTACGQNHLQRGQRSTKTTGTVN